jgi:glucose-6-phosphate isomerase
MRKQLPDIVSFADEVRKNGFRHVVLLGMGGSSLGAEVIRQTFGNKSGYPDLIVLDSTVPANVQAVTDRIDPARTLFLVSSKSGTTIEVISLFRYYQYLVATATGNENAGSNFVAITDPGTPLAELAKHERFRRTFLTPPDIGGRFSVLSGFGLVPAALTGIDIEEILDRAEGMKSSCAADMSPGQNPGAVLGAILGTLAGSGRDKLTLFTSPSLSGIGLWIEQLIAESTGKEGKGIIPIIAEPIVEPSQYSNDRIFVYIRVSEDVSPALDKAVEQLESAGQPVVTIEIDNEYNLGAEFFRWEFTTAVAGTMLDVNPFEQPDVQSAKQATRIVIKEFTDSGRLPRPQDIDSPTGLLSGAGVGSYLAIMAYLPQTPEVDRILLDLRRQILEKYGIPTQLGYGPRYLHSIGQLHKGGPATGLFLQITMDHEKDIPVPGSPYTFGVLADAQALGDFRALQSLGRHVCRCHLHNISEISSLLEQVSFS